MKELPLSKVYQLIEPGPVVLLTTARKGQANVMTMSWHMMVEFEPPLIACIVSSADYSFAALKATRECVISIPGGKLARKLVQVGNSSGHDINKFKAFGLTPVSAKRVKPPLVAECFANLECKVVDTRFVNIYNLFILEVRIWSLCGGRQRDQAEVKDAIETCEIDRLPETAYTPDVTAHVYTSLAEKARRVVSAGHSAVVDAVYAGTNERSAIAVVATSSNVEFHGLFLAADFATRLSRVAARIDDASDADTSVARQQERYDLSDLSWTRVDASGSHAQTLARAIHALSEPTEVRN